MLNEHVVLGIFRQTKLLKCSHVHINTFSLKRFTLYFYIEIRNVTWWNGPQSYKSLFLQTASPIRDHQMVLLGGHFVCWILTNGINFTYYFIHPAPSLVLYTTQIPLTHTHSQNGKSWKSLEFAQFHLHLGEIDNFFSKIFCNTIFVEWTNSSWRFTHFWVVLLYFRLKYTILL